MPRSRTGWRRFIASEENTPAALKKSSSCKLRRKKSSRRWTVAKKKFRLWKSLSRARAMLRPQVQRLMERITGGVLVGVGVLLLAGT